MPSLEALSLVVSICSGLVSLSAIVFAVGVFKQKVVSHEARIEKVEERVDSVPADLAELKAQVVHINTEIVNIRDELREQNRLRRDLEKQVSGR